MSTAVRDSRWSRPSILALAASSLVLWSLLLVHAGGAIADGVTGGDRSALSPISQLGTKADLARCATAPLSVGNATAAYCEDWSAIVAKDGTVEVVSLHALNESGVVDGFRGVLPMSLAWGDSIADVRNKLGEPNRITSIYGTPTFVYMYRGLPFGSLELRFSGGDRLMGINACLER